MIMNFSNFQDLMREIPKWEKSQEEKGFRFNISKNWEGVTFDEIVDGIDRYGDNGKFGKRELFFRLDNFITFSPEDELPIADYLRRFWYGLKALDEHFGSNMVSWQFGDKSLEETIREWEFEDEMERESEERQEFIDQWAMPMLVNDCGLSEYEAEEFLFDLGY